MDFKLFRRIAGVSRKGSWLLAVLMAGLLASAATASEFTINACQADRAEFSTRAFENFATRGMMWKRACNPEGPGLRGLVTANVVRAGRVEQGARSYFVLRAPEGTHFRRFAWSGQVRRRDCRYALQVWAARPDGSTVAIKNVRANRGCPAGSGYQAAGWPRPRSYDVAGATAIVQRVLCVGSKQTPFCSARSLNYVRTFTAAATVVDTSPPGVVISPDTPLARGEWVSGTQQMNYNALDNVGVRVARAVASGTVVGVQERPCNFAQRVPCPNGPGAITVDTHPLPDGPQALLVRAADTAGNLSDSTPVTVRIDNTAPGAVPVGVAGGDGWRNVNRFDLVWSNSESVDQAPIAAVHYRLCGPAGASCAANRVAATNIGGLPGLSVPGAGEWQLRVWREDAAGNHQPANASVPVVLRYDPEPPRVVFDELNRSDPTLVTATVTDEVSGLAGGQIEISREGSGIWEQLSTAREGNRLSARIDDARHPAGNYVLRATAQDRATNQTTSDRKADGAQMMVALPLRTPTVVSAGILKPAPDRGTRKRRTARRRAHRRLLHRARIGLGGELRLAGEVRTSDGAPIPNAPVQIVAWSTSSPEQVIATAQADERGRFTFVTRAQSTTGLRAVYPGTPTTLPSHAEATVLVPATSSVRAAPRRVRNGQSVTFRGRVRSRPTPAHGKLVELQVVLSGRWQTFRTLRSEPDGRWTARYRFRRSCGLLRYRFRARLPEEAGYPFEAGHTRAVAVEVRGAPCR